MNKFITKSIIAAIALGASSSAYATVHSYNLNHGNVLTINTATGEGSLVGNRINANFTGDFSSFTGGENPANLSFPIESIEGTRIIGGNTLNVTDQSIADHPYSLNFTDSGEVNLWARWGGGNKYGDFIRGVDGYTYTPTSSSTSSGGLSVPGGDSLSSSGGAGGSTGGSAGGSSGGGTDVPAPGALLLFGLGAAGLAFGNRRRKMVQN